MSVKTRFAPSPTGYLHLGGARTAIFNWLFARHHKGSFIIRIEDTDRARSKKEYLDEILDSLSWLGLTWDEPVVKQSERLEIYRKYAHMLLSSGKAYKCYVSPEELEEKRIQAKEKGEFFRYKREWAEKNAAPDKPFAIRLAVPQSKVLQIRDLIKGKIEFRCEEIDDFIILKRDGYPTYNFAVVIDDALMEITHIIRGDDHLINTPKQLLIYEALGFQMPEVAHVPMIFGQDKTKLSKRHGAVSISAYREKGYLPHALVNYLARLGWSYGDQEIFSLEELIEKFSLENVGKSPSIFNPEKLLWLNSYYIKSTPTPELAKLLIPFYKKHGVEVKKEDPRFLKIVELFKERAKTLEEFVEKSRYLFTEDLEFNEKDKEKFLIPENKKVLQLVLNELSSLEQFTQDDIKTAFTKVMEETGLKLGKIAQPVRVAITGTTKSPGIFEVIELLGKEKTISRLEKAINYIESKTLK